MARDFARARNIDEITHKDHRGPFFKEFFDLAKENPEAIAPYLVEPRYPLSGRFNAHGERVLCALDWVSLASIVMMDFDMLAIECAYDTHAATPRYTTSVLFFFIIECIIVVCWAFSRVLVDVDLLPGTTPARRT